MTKPRRHTPQPILTERGDRRRRAEDAAARREPILPRTNRRLHAVAGRVFGGRAHVELHRCAAVVFGVDHLSGLSERQAWVLIRGLEGGRAFDPSARRTGMLRQLEALLARGGEPMRRYVEATATERFGLDTTDAQWLDDCGIPRLGALCNVAQYWLSKVNT